MTQDYEMFIWSALQFQEMDLILPDGGRVHYVRTSPGTGYTNAEFESTNTPTRFYKSRVRWDPDVGGWDVILADGTIYYFGVQQPMQWMQDRYGNRITLTRTPANSGNITRIDGPSGRSIEFTYDAANHITQAKDNLGRTVAYEYDLLGRMTKATYPDGSTNEYGWAVCPGGPISNVCTQLLTVKDARGNVSITNEYTNGRVTKQTYADTTTNLFAYTVDVNGKITQADVTDARSNVRRITFNASGYVTTDTYGLGKPEAQTFSFTRAAVGNLLTDVTDPLGRVTHTVYDVFGNPSTITRLFGTPQAVTTTYTYEPMFQQVATVKDPLNHTTTFGYDAAGYLTSITDPSSTRPISLTIRPASPSRLPMRSTTPRCSNTNRAIL